VNIDKNDDKMLVVSFFLCKMVLLPTARAGVESTFISSACTTSFYV
jgi:hypothetical protein